MKLKYKVLVGLIISIFFFSSIGIYLLVQDTNNKIAKSIKEKTPHQIKNFLKKTIFYIPSELRDYEKLKKANLLKNKELDLKEHELLMYKNLYEHGNSNFKTLKTSQNLYSINEFILPMFDKEDVYKNDTKGYLGVINDNIIVMFGSGKSILINREKLNNKQFDYQKIKNNLNEQNNFDHQLKWAGVKDLYIDQKKIYISLTKKIDDDCYNTSVLQSKIETQFLNFEEFFIPKECALINEGFKGYPSFINFNGYQTGGRIIANEQYIFLTVGDYNQLEKVQNNQSNFRKIIKFDKNNSEIKKISKGHRNQQGMLLENQNIIVSEHGPKGGDEINLLKIDESQIKNFGWPIASYGEHYDSVPLNKKILDVAPLKKSHKMNGFVEPIYYFKDSIGISEIIKNNFSQENSYFVTSLKNHTIYEIVFDSNYQNPKIIDKIVIGERIRDIIFDEQYSSYYVYTEGVSTKESGSPKISILKKIN